MLEVGRFIFFVSSNINAEIKKLNKNQNKRLKQCKKKTMVKEILLHVFFFSVNTCNFFFCFRETKCFRSVSCRQSKIRNYYYSQHQDPKLLCKLVMNKVRDTMFANQHVLNLAWLLCRRSPSASNTLSCTGYTSNFELKKIGVFQ